LVAVADHVPTPFAIGVGTLFQKDRQLGQDGLPNCRLGVDSDQVSHFIAKGWIQEQNFIIVAHGDILLF